MLHATIMQSHATETHDSRVDSHLIYTHIGAVTDDQRAINTGPHNCITVLTSLMSLYAKIINFRTIKLPYYCITNNFRTI